LDRCRALGLLDDVDDRLVAALRADVEGHQPGRVDPRDVEVFLGEIGLAIPEKIIYISNILFV
jgi:hypothetical protein